MIDDDNDTDHDKYNGNTYSILLNINKCATLVRKNKKESDDDNDNNNDKVITRWSVELPCLTESVNE